MISSLGNLVARRDLLGALVASELKASSAGTKLGWLWWLLDPVLMMLIYWAIFAGLLGRGGAIYAPYPIFIFCALVVWKHLSSAASKSTRVLISNEAVIKSVPFPTIALPVSLVLSGLVYFLFGFAVLLAASIAWRGQHHSGNLLPLAQVPALVVLQVMIVTGICLPLATLGVLVKDVSAFTTHLLRVGFYVSPGLYGHELVRDLLERYLGAAGSAGYFIYMLNPFAGLITGYRDCVFYGRFIEPGSWAVLVIEAALVLWLGNVFYRHYDRRAIKYL